VGAGALGVGVGLVAAGVIDVLSVFYTIMGVSLFVPVVAGLLTRRAGTPDALAAMAAGVAIVGGMRLFAGGRPVAGFTPAMAGLAGAAVAFFVAQAIRRARGGPDRPPNPTLQPTAE
jgi:SSS family solute:Na+ symporter